MADGKPQLIAAVTEVSSLFVFPRGCAKEIQTRVKEVDSHPQSKYIINRQPIRDPLPPLIYPIIWFSSVDALFNVSDQGVDQTSTFSHRLPVALLRAAQIPVCCKRKKGGQDVTWEKRRLLQQLERDKYNSWNDTFALYFFSGCRSHHRSFAWNMFNKIITCLSHITTVTRCKRLYSQSELQRFQSVQQENHLQQSGNHKYYPKKGVSKHEAAIQIPYIPNKYTNVTEDILSFEVLLLVCASVLFPLLGILQRT